jgi:uncharacterized protein YllA (UPF0747 family)|tara:strand:+ start:881 stop:1102 length:222 start_codon:yes stop_codon:yes gene_type:complete
MSLIPVEDKPGFYRDSNTNAIVNKNNNDYEIYMKTKTKMLSKEERINHLEDKVDNLSSDIGDIKSMLQSLINK